MNNNITVAEHEYVQYLVQLIQCYELPFSNESNLCMLTLKLEKDRHSEGIFLSYETSRHYQ